MPVRTVAILGAGPSGLSSIKSCLDEGLKPTCFEQFDEIGGTWRFTEKPLPGQGPTVFENLTVNTSQRIVAFSDFPFPEGTPEFPDYQTMWNYLRDYCEYFDLRKHIKFNTEVKSVTRSSTYDEDGTWVVTVLDKLTNQELAKQFDAVLVGTGFYRHPFIPDIPGLDKFKGEIMHAHSYRRPDIFTGKKVLVLGRFFSGADLASAAATCGKEVILSVGHGCWVYGKFDKHGVPFDFLIPMASVFRSPSYVYDILAKLCNDSINHEQYKLQTPSMKRPFEEPVMASDQLVTALKAGKVSVKLSFVSSFEGHRVLFEDGSSVDDVDMVAFGTGYKPDWSFLPPEARPDPVENFSHYRTMIPINCQHPTLALLGSFAAPSPFYAFVELQTRWITAVFTGHMTLPSQKDMRTEVEEQLMKFKLRSYTNKYRYVSPLDHAYDLSKDMQIVPPFWTTLFTHPIELYRWYFGPPFSAMFRMYGRLAWSRARAAWEDCYNKPIVK